VNREGIGRYLVVDWIGRGARDRILAIVLACKALVRIADVGVNG
jgi:hypothetical protein